MEFYCSYPMQPDIPRPDHLLSSATAEAKRTRLAAGQHNNESTEGGSPLAGTVTEGEVRGDNSRGPAVELAAALPLVPQGRRVVRKRKALEVESPRYWFAVLLICQISIMLCTDGVHV
jgi:hypothetical protein